MEVKIRPAKSTEASQLSALALRSKAYWPYSDDFIRECKEALTISEEHCGNGYVYVAEMDGKIVGFYGFSTNSQEPEMSYLFVEPQYIGSGIGFKLWNHSIEFAKAQGWSSFLICSDPYAADKFYLPLGCVRIGDFRPAEGPKRILPLLRFNFEK